MLDGRSPHGERGLKCLDLSCNIDRLPSLPARGAWIEIRVAHISGLSVYSRSPHGERGLKSKKRIFGDGIRMSLPARGAWIEIPNSCKIGKD